MSEVPLPSTVSRNLGDKLYEKRKIAALEIENLVKELIPDKDGEQRIRQVVVNLVKQFAQSTNANARKGGLIGLAATAIGLGQLISKFLDVLIPPVLECFTDQDSRVRYYACESLYNIAKVARNGILTYFNEVFDGLCKLSADADGNVKNGALLLDRLIKDIVTETDEFRVEKFIPLLRERIYVINPFVRQFIVSWITVLDSVPDIEMLDHLPEVLDGVFIMLSDQHSEIRRQADSALCEFLRGIKQATHVEYNRMVPILMPHCQAKDEFTALTAVTWVNDFVLMGKEELMPFAANILDAILPSLAHPLDTIRSAAAKTNHNLLKLINDSSVSFDIGAVLRAVTLQLLSEFVQPRQAALRWILMLLLKVPEEVSQFLDELFPALLKTLSDEAEEVVRLDLEVLARISENLVYFDRFIKSLMKLFATDRKLLESRGPLIVRQLSLHLDGEKIFRAIAADLEEEDLEFAWTMVQSLNIILFTSPELAGLRTTLKDLGTVSGRSLFTALYRSWSHNPVAAFALCLFSQAYEHAAWLVMQFANMDVTLSFLLEVDKLVQLLESPIFTHLRLQLIEPRKHAFLFKALYGLLMLLPQSSAFDALHRRLASVSTLTLLHLLPDCELGSIAEPSKSKNDAGGVEFDALMDHFVAVQKRREEAMQQAVRDKEVADTLSRIRDGQGSSIVSRSSAFLTRQELGGSPSTEKTDLRRR